MDTVRLPDHLPEGVSAVDVVQLVGRLHRPAPGQHAGEVRRAVRHTSRPPTRRRCGPRSRPPAATRSGPGSWPRSRPAWTAAPSTTTSTASAASTPPELAALDPTGFRDGKAGQPDDTTCGSATLVMSRMMNDPAYAMWILTGYDPATGTQTGDGSDVSQDQRFADAALDMHDTTNSWWQNGQPQVPWPEAWGTTPGAVLNEMNHGQSAGPRSRLRHAVRRPGRPGGDVRPDRGGQ